jgi:thioredoxin-related protein
MIKRQLLQILLLSSLLLPLSLWADGGAKDVTVLKVTDLQALGQESLERNIPIAIMLSADGCSWCIKLEEEHFKPMLRSGEYENKVLLGKFKIDDRLQVKDFDGKMVSPDEINRRYGSFVTPTIIYLDGHGSELSKKMVGLGTSHYFGSYLDMAIDESLDTLRRNTPLRAKLAKLAPQ